MDTSTDSSAPTTSSVALAEPVTEPPVVVEQQHQVAAVEATPPAERPEPEPPPCPSAPPQFFDRSPHFEDPPDMTGLRYPWTQPVAEDPPEDNDQSNPLPCLFTDEINFMETTQEEAVKIFIKLCETHISPEMRKYTPIMEFLMGEALETFCPSVWEGVRYCDPIQLEFAPDTPYSNHPPRRPVNVKLYQNVIKELQRMGCYFIEPSTSSWSSPLAIAPKPTPPFLRICGDYTQINKYIICPNRNIPNVLHLLEKLKGTKLYCDLDMPNAFHQFRLAPETARYLALDTPIGKVQPRFMPEGIPPASGILQEFVEKAFGDADFTLVAFDNMLVTAKGDQGENSEYMELYHNFVWVVRRANYYNIKLKMAKCWIGFREVDFFGYVIREGSYTLSDKRIAAVREMPFPTKLKEMQRFLGMAIFFSRFIPGFHNYTAILNRMTHKDTDWKRPETWPEGHMEAFNEFKDALLKTCSLYYPDYNLEWALQADSSDYGVGSVLLMYIPQPDGTKKCVPLSFSHHTYSPPARGWTTIEKECYGLVDAVKKNEYALRAKTFILETDHRNLLWMETSVVPKIIRWKIYLQSFKFYLRHIPGKQNIIADYFSRMSPPDDVDPDADDEPVSPDVLALIEEAYDKIPVEELLAIDAATPAGPAAAAACPAPAIPSAPISTSSTPLVSNPPSSTADTGLPLYSPDALLREIHSGRMAHPGIRGTMEYMDKYRPGHGLSQDQIREFVMTCPTCQKFRLGMSNNLKPLVRNLRPGGKRKVIGSDTLKMSPADKDGYMYIIMVVNHHTKHCWGFRSKTHDATSTALAIFQYICMFGLADALYSDPGTEFTAEVVQHLNAWLGIRHIISIVDRHESNGV